MPAALKSHLSRVRQEFISRRSPPSVMPLTVSRRRLYILPTRSGALFALLLVVMLLGSTNYSNSLGFALTFWLASIALVSMHHAHRNLLGLQIRAVEAAPVFAGDSVRFQITLAQNAGRVRRAVRVSGADAPDHARVNIDPHAEETIVDVDIVASARGRMDCPRLRLESIYPIGLFRSWSWLTPRASVIVYPRRAGRERLPAAAGGEPGTDARPVAGRDDFVGHRGYRISDSPRHIDWKASARSDGLRVREYVDLTTYSLWLDYDALGALDREARLSQLALWITQAERETRPYGLRLPDFQLEPGLGAAHQHACLRALALA